MRRSGEPCAAGGLASPVPRAPQAAGEAVRRIPGCPLGLAACRAAPRPRQLGPPAGWELASFHGIFGWETWARGWWRLCALQQRRRACGWGAVKEKCRHHPGCSPGASSAAAQAGRDPVGPQSSCPIHRAPQGAFRGRVLSSPHATYCSCCWKASALLCGINVPCSCSWSGKIIIPLPASLKRLLAELCSPCRL